MPTTPAAVEIMVNARSDGATMRETARAAGIHLATLCRWQARDSVLRDLLREAHREWRCFELSLASGPRPRVRWRRDCPLCKARVVVRTAPGKLRFWRCGRWPRCSWASWRPRAPRDCKRCGGPCYWSHSRKSIGCGACGMRIIAH
jgi:hypothetical protein